MWNIWCLQRKKEKKSRTNNKQVQKKEEKSHAGWEYKWDKASQILIEWTCQTHGKDAKNWISNRICKT